MTRAFLPIEAVFNDVDGGPSALVATATSEISVVFSLSAVQEVPDSTLAELVQQLNQQKHMVDAELLLYLGEFDFRKLYREAACSSFFEYLTRRLGYSEDVAYRRMWCARLLREYPVIHEYLRSGQIHMAALLLLKPLLTQDNHRELLSAAVGKSKREVEKFVAARHPQPDAPTRIRRLPEPGRTPSISSLSATTTIPKSPLQASHSGRHLAAAHSETSHPGASLDASGNGASLDASGNGASLDASGNGAPLDASGNGAPLDASGNGAPLDASGNGAPLNGLRSSESQAKVALSLASRGVSRAPSIVPSSASSYRVVFTASERLKQKLDRAAELASHRNHPTDLASLLERALDLLIAKQERRRFGAKGPRRQDRVAIRRDPAIPSDAAQPLATHPQANPSETNRPRTTHPQANPSETNRPRATQSRTAQSCMVQPQTKQSCTVQPQTKQSCTVQPQTKQSETTRSIANGVPVSGARRGSGRCSRYIPAAVRREVWERDGGQCTYVNAKGERCQGRHFLQFDHRIAQALGGASTVENLRLRCAAHNALAAEQVLGVERVRTAITEAHQRRRFARDSTANEVQPALDVASAVESASCETHAESSQ
jgi:5-methylcytosine-specific restriction endonuclease McrA